MNNENDIKGIITICGSLKFYNKMLDIYSGLTSRGWIVFFPSVSANHRMELRKSVEEMTNLMYNIHIKKIEMSDLILIVDIDHYVGADTTKEIEYAKELHMPVIYYVKDLNEDLNKMNEKVLAGSK